MFRIGLVSAWPRMGASSTAERGRVPKICLCREGHCRAVHGAGWNSFHRMANALLKEGLAFPSLPELQEHLGNSQARDVVTLGCSVQG